MVPCICLFNVNICVVTFTMLELLTHLFISASFPMIILYEPVFGIQAHSKSIVRMLYYIQGVIVQNLTLWFPKEVISVDIRQSSDGRSEIQFSVREMITFQPPACLLVILSRLIFCPICWKLILLLLSKFGNFLMSLEQFH